MSRAVSKLHENLLLVESIFQDIRASADSSVDLTYFMERAIINRIFLQAYRALEDVVAGDNTYLRGWRRLRDTYFQYIANLTRWFKESEALVSLFSDNGVTVMPLKGLLLSHAHYPDKFLRFSHDMDFMFQDEEDRADAGKLLKARGYRVLWIRPKAIHYVRHIGRTSLHCDAHVFAESISPAYEYPKLDGIWEEASKGTIGDADVLFPRPEHSFLILCLHASSNGIFSLRDLSDAYHILRGDFDWEIIEKHAEIAGWRHILHLPLGIVSVIETTLSDETSVPSSTLKAVGRGSPETDYNRMLQVLEQRKWGFPVSASSLPFPYLVLNSTHLLRSLAPKSREPAVLPFRNVLRAACEIYLCLARVGPDYGNQYGLICMRNWLRTYIPTFPQNLVHRPMSRGRG
ncbi:MAG: nucleotidyltransferase family protein [Thermoplasmata archaeon]